MALSKRAAKRLEMVARVKEERRDNTQQLAYLSRAFLLFGLPFKPVTGTAHYRRESGDECIEITASDRFGLPYGQDILVLIWISTLAVLQMRDGVVPREVEFARASDMLRAFDLPLDGRNFQRMEERFMRVFFATYFYLHRNKAGKWERFFSLRFIESMELNLRPDNEAQPGLFEGFKNNKIRLTESFARDLEQNHPPIDRSAVKLWSDSPGQLFFYLWLVYRCYAARVESHVRLMGLGSLQEQCGIQGYDDPVQGFLNFRAKVRGWLNGVLAIWPACPVKLVTVEGGGDYLRIVPTKGAVLEADNPVNP